MSFHCSPPDIEVSYSLMKMNFETLLGVARHMYYQLQYDNGVTHTNFLLQDALLHSLVHIRTTTITWLVKPSFIEGNIDL